MQHLTNDAKAILLLCGRFGKGDLGDGARPLSLGEYNRLAEWMMAKGVRPADLVAGAFEGIEADMPEGIASERIRKLLSRGTAMALAVEKWMHNGIWIVCRSDDAYPGRLKQHLKRTQAPPILFGVGDAGLLCRGGLAVVGSRNVDATGEAFTRSVGATCARDGVPVVSGGARGVDQVAVLSCLEAGGQAVGILADGLFKAAVAGKYRTGLRERRLVLASPFHPEARFNVGSAMGRNKLVYAMADHALVVSAEKGKGGTWSGAREELNRPAARPVFVRVEGAVPAGNRALIELGARPFPKPPWREPIRKLLEREPRPEKKRVPSQAMLFGEPAPEPVAGVGLKEEITKFDDSPAVNVEVTAAAGDLAPGVYEAVLPLLLDRLTDWQTPKALAEALDVRKVQLDDWIKRALEEGRVVQKKRPVRYRRK